MGAKGGLLSSIFYYYWNFLIKKKDAAQVIQKKRGNSPYLEEGQQMDLVPFSSVFPRYHNKNRRLFFFFFRGESYFFSLSIFAAEEEKKNVFIKKAATLCARTTNLWLGARARRIFFFFFFSTCNPSGRFRLTRSRWKQQWESLHFPNETKRNRKKKKKKKKCIEIDRRLIRLCVLAPVEWRSFITCIVLSLFPSLAAAELPVERRRNIFPLVGTFGMQTLTAPVNSQKKENNSLS